MPTNFHISSQPALRCVSGEAYPLHASPTAGGFFSRLRVAERLVIHSGPQQTAGLAARERTGSCAQLEPRAGFRKKFAHA
jgi:hypothetical protein